MEQPKPKKKFSFVERYVSGETNSAVWSLVSRGFAFGSTFLILSSLSLYQYGVYQLLLQSYAFLVVFIGIGGNVVKNDILRYAGEGKIAYAKKLYFELTFARTIIGIFLWALTFFGATLFSFRFGPDAVNLIRILSFLYLYEILIRAVQPILNIRMKFFALSVQGAANKAFRFFFLTFFYFFGNIGLTEVVFSQVIAVFLSVAILIPSFISAYKPWLYIAPVKERLMFRIITTYGKWSLFKPILNKATSFTSTWLIKLLISTEAVAIFTVAQSMVGLVKGFTPTGSLSTLVPLSLQDKERTQRILSYGTKYLVFLSVILALGGLATAPPLIHIFFPQYVVALPFFAFMLLHMVANAVGAVPGIFLFILRKQKFLFLQGALASISTIVLYLTLIPFFGIWGLAFEYVLTPVLMLIVLYWYLMTIKPGISMQWKSLITFGKEDKIFLSNIYTEIKGMAQKRLLRIKKSA